MIPFRFDKELKHLEKRLRLSARWLTDNSEYRNIISKHDRRKKIIMLTQLRTTALEKTFLMGIRKKYAGTCSYKYSYIVTFYKVYSLSDIFIY